MSAPVWAQHPRLKGKKGAEAYEKAVAHVREGLKKASFPVKMIAGWLLLADERYPEDLEEVIKAALDWEKTTERNNHSKNWHPALAAVLLAEHYKHHPRPDVKAAMEKLVAHFVKTQEKTGGWYKWHEGVYKDRPDYPVYDLGFLTAMAYGFLFSARAHGIKVPGDTIDKATQCLDGYTNKRGIGYGTPKSGRGGGGDRTGARGCFAILGLAFAGRTDHPIYTTYVELLKPGYPNLDQGHHVGAFHCLGLTLGARILGPEYYSRLVSEWMDKLIAKQEPDGGIYVGDDGDAGGEVGLLRGNLGSTAAVALMILMQNPDALKPKGKAKGGPDAGGGGAGSGSGSGSGRSPFGRPKKENDDEPVPTRPGGGN
jgi:hypothetical protein